MLLELVYVTSKRVEKLLEKMNSDIKGDSPISIKEYLTGYVLFS